MGVKKLTTILRQFYGLPLLDPPDGRPQDEYTGPLEDLEADGQYEKITFVMDGLFLMFPNDLSHESNSADAIERAFEFFGDYETYRKWLHERISSLKAKGIKIVVILDGKRTIHFKEEDQQKRREERETKWLWLWHIFHGEDTASSRKDFPDFDLSLMRIQYMNTLRELGLEIIEADGEAELEVVMYVRSHNAAANKEVFFALGGDSDLMIMKDCPYIQFHDLVIDERVRTRKIFRRSETARALGFDSEAMLIEGCLLMGNDFVCGEDAQVHLQNSEGHQIHFKTSYLNWRRRLAGGEKKTYTEDKLRFLKCKIQEEVDAGREARLQVVSSDRATEVALQYSRQFYNCGFLGLLQRKGDSYATELEYLSNEQESYIHNLRDAFVSLEGVNIGRMCLDLMKSEDTSLFHSFFGTLIPSSRKDVLESMLQDLIEESQGINVNLIQSRRSEMVVMLESTEYQSLLATYHWLDCVTIQCYKSLINAVCEEFSVYPRVDSIFDGRLYKYWSLRSPMQALPVIDPSAKPTSASPGGPVVNLDSLTASLQDAQEGGSVPKRILIKRLNALLPEFKGGKESFEELEYERLSNLQMDIAECLIRAHMQPNTGILVHAKSLCNMTAKKLIQNMVYLRNWTPFDHDGNPINILDTELVHSKGLLDFIIVDNLADIRVQTLPESGRTKIVINTGQVPFEYASNLPEFFNLIIDTGFRGRSGIFNPVKLNRSYIAASHPTIAQYLLIPGTSVIISGHISTRNNKYPRAVSSALANFPHRFRGSVPNPANPDKGDFSVVTLDDPYDAARVAANTTIQFNFNGQMKSRKVYLYYEPPSIAIVDEVVNAPHIDQPLITGGPLNLPLHLCLTTGIRRAEKRYLEALQGALLYEASFENRERPLTGEHYNHLRELVDSLQLFNDEYDEDGVVPPVTLRRQVSLSPANDADLIPSVSQLSLGIDNKEPLTAATVLCSGC